MSLVLQSFEAAIEVDGLLAGGHPLLAAAEADEAIAEIIQARRRASSIGKACRLISILRRLAPAGKRTAEPTLCNRLHSDPS
jgi:hypothetical protein